jgi:hypothetical protein
MKRILLFSAAVLVAASSFTSCKKDYTCECTSTYTYGGVSTTSNYSATAHLKKSDAKTWCTGQAGSGTGYTYSCALK